MTYLAHPSRIPKPQHADGVLEKLGGERKSHVDHPARHQAVPPWPDDLLTSFSLRMSLHGMSISRIDMTVDASYARQQLGHAREMGDPELALLADTLLGCFEAHQSEIPWESH